MACPASTLINQFDLVEWIFQWSVCTASVFVNRLFFCLHSIYTIFKLLIPIVQRTSSKYLFCTCYAYTMRPIRIPNACNWYDATHVFNIRFNEVWNKLKNLSTLNNTNNNTINSNYLLSIWGREKNGKTGELKEDEWGEKKETNEN